MYYGRIPPHIGLGDRVSISKEAQQKYEESQQKIKKVEIVAEPGLENSFILFLLVSGSFIAGTIIGTLWSWYA